ncbi:MAG: hypothetical protein AAF403_03275 [Pseudomonadota bacterium]
MRLLIVGQLDGHMASAAKMAMERNAQVDTVDNLDAVVTRLRQGQGADLALIDVNFDIGRLVSKLKSERIHLPLVACGGEGTSPQKAKKSIHEGACEYITLPPEPQ